MKTELQLRAEKLFRRRPTTPWDRSEIKAWEMAVAIASDMTEQEWKAIELFYSAPKDTTYARRNLATMLNNLNGEIAKAQDWCRLMGHRLGNENPTIKLGRFTYDEQNPPSLDQLRGAGLESEFGNFMQAYRNWKAQL